MSTDSQMRTAETKMTAAAGTDASFGALKQIDAGLLRVGYAEAGPADSPAVILLHGWPYDIYSYGAATPLLASAGYRVIVPYLRGYGTTRFLSEATFRNGQQAALGVDAVALMDALGIDRAIIAGFDWGARTANIMAALWPERCRAIVSVSGYLIGSQQANQARHCHRRPSCSGGISTISRPNAAVRVMNDTGTTSPGSSGRLLRRAGPLMRPPSIAPRGRSTILTTSIS
jgi:pimeloyl-ACP methyl ester carboxylesterase